MNQDQSVSLDTPTIETGSVNFDVDSSTRKIIRTKYWRELGLLVPLVVVWEYMLFRYVGPSLFSGHSGSSSGRGFGTLVGIPFIVFFTWYAKLKKKIEDLFISDFAQRNGYSYEAQGTVDETYGSIFRVDGRQSISSIVTGTYDGHSIRMFLYDLTRGSGRNQVTYGNTVIELTLPGKVPAMLLDSKRSRNFGLNLSRASGIANTISLEGNFNDYFTLHAPIGAEIEALEVFAPNVMAIVVDESRNFDIEFVANKIYIYLDKYVTTSNDLEQMYRLAKLLLKNVSPLASRLANDSTVLIPPINLTLPRYSTNRRTTIWYVVSTTVIVLIGIGMMILSLLSPHLPATTINASAAYIAATKQAEIDLAASTRENSRGPAIVSDGLAALQAAATADGRSGAHYYIGMGYFWERQYSQALTEEDLSLKEDPHNLAAMVVDAELLVNLDRPTEAIAMANRDLASDPTDGSALRTRAFAEANLGQNTAAITDVDKSIAIDQADPKKVGFVQYGLFDRKLIEATYRPLRFDP